ncbi:MAG: hypothetical protein AMXMBFR33_19520 [Candidatus Xenobia bacterium]
MPGPRRATRARRPSRSRREIEEERFAPKPLTPRERFRNTVIHAGVAVLLFAFLLTSGIVCVNLNQDQSQAQQELPKQSELNYWREQAAKDPANMEAVANVGHFLIEESFAKQGDEQKKALDEAEQNLAKVTVMVDSPQRSFAIQEMARVKLLKKDYAGAQAQIDEALKHADRPIPQGEDAVSVEEGRKAERASAYRLQASLFVEQGKQREALAVLDKVAEISPASVMQVLFQKADLHAQLGEKDRALEQLDMAQKFAGTDQERMMVMILRQQLIAPPPSASPSPGGAEALPSPAPVSTASPAPVATTSPAPVTPAPLPTAASPAPIATTSPTPVASPSR